MIYEIPQRSQEIPGLEDYLRAIRERWRLILVITILTGFGVSFVNSQRTPSYEATARVVANPTIANAIGSNLVQPALEREREVMASNAVASRAADRLDGVSPRDLVRDIDVSFVNDSDTLELSYSSPDPEIASQRVDAVADAYVALREEASLAVYNSQIAAFEAELEEVTPSYEAIIDEITATRIERTAAYYLDSTDLTRQVTIDAANESLVALDRDRQLLSNRINDATRGLRSLERNLAARGVTAEVIQYSEVPQSPSGPGSNFIVAAGIGLGLMAGVALAFVLDRLDRRAKDAADVEAALGATVLGNIPHFGLSSRRSSIVMLGDTRSHRNQRVREAYRRVRASLQFLQSSKGIKSIVVTSARPNEGKSTTVANLGIAAAQAGARVVIVSADMRRPTQERLLGIHTTRGLSEFLKDQTITDILLPVPGVDGLVLLPAGTPAPNPGELLGSAAFGTLLEELCSQFDLVLIDMPPVLSAADSGAVAPHAHGVLVVVDSQRTDTDSLLRVRTTIERSGGTIVGAILNRDSSDDGISIRRDRYAYEKVANRA